MDYLYNFLSHLHRNLKNISPEKKLEIRKRIIKDLSEDNILSPLYLSFKNTDDDDDDFDFTEVKVNKKIEIKQDTEVVAYEAVLMGNINILNRLYNDGYDFTTTTSFGASPVQFAVMYQKDEVIQLFKKLNVL